MNMMKRFRSGDTAYIIESDRRILEGKILKCTGGLYLLKFKEGGAIQVKVHRLYACKDDAQAEVDRLRNLKKPKYYGDFRLDS